MYKISYTKKFEKSLKLCQKRGLNIDLAKSAIKILEKMANYQPYINHIN